MKNFKNLFLLIFLTSFLLFLFCFGLYISLVSSQDMYKAYKTNNWESTKGLIIKSEIIIINDDDKEPYRSVIIYKYKVNGINYRSDQIDTTKIYSANKEYPQELIKKFPKSSITKIFYNPINHKESVLLQGINLDLLYPFITGIFIIIISFIFYLNSKKKHLPFFYKKSKM
ncbi:MAG: DUF3592 domain-containing protein [Desulfobacterales bacterium]|nr:DUF3592 domain-containing protein [Desulfobacterales bacterium]